MKIILLFFFCLSITKIHAQKVDSIYVNLYTDSLKRGTYNYINVDGKMSNGRFLPLDSSQIRFTASAGKFSGNSLWVDQHFMDRKIRIRIELRNNRSQYQEFDMYIKQLPDGPLKTMEEILGDGKHPGTRKKSGSSN